MLELPKLKEMFKAWNLLLKLFQLESFSDEVYNQELVDLPGGGINLGEHESQLRSPFCLHVGGLSNTSLPIWSARGYPPPPLSTKFLPSNMLQRDRKGLIGDQNGLKLAHRGLKPCVLTRIIWSFVKNKLHQILLCRFNQQRGTPPPFVDRVFGKPGFANLGDTLPSPCHPRPIKGMGIMVTVKRTFCLSASWSMKVSITSKAGGENLLRSSILVRYYKVPSRLMARCSNSNRYIWPEKKKCKRWNHIVYRHYICHKFIRLLE